MLLLVSDFNPLKLFLNLYSKLPGSVVKVCYLECVGEKGQGGIIFFYLSSYFALISLYTNFHDPRTIPSGRKVCVGGGWWVVVLKVTLVLALVQNQV